VRTAAEWASEIGPWDRLVEAGRRLWGERWALTQLGNVSAGIKSHTERCNAFGDLLDESKSLCCRIRYARLRTKHKAWWNVQLQAVGTVNDASLVCLVALTWASSATLLGVQLELDKAVNILNDAQWKQLIRAVKRARSRIGTERGGELVIGALSEKLSNRTLAAFAVRAGKSSVHQLFDRIADWNWSNERELLDLALEDALDINDLGSPEWTPRLDVVRRCYEAGAFYTGSLLMSRKAAVPGPVAEAIIGEPAAYPSFLVAIAEEACRRAVAGDAQPVARVADAEKWFVDSEGAAGVRKARVPAQTGSGRGRKA